MKGCRVRYQVLEVACHSWTVRLVVASNSDYPKALSETFDFPWNLRQDRLWSASRQTMSLSPIAVGGAAVSRTSVFDFCLESLAFGDLRAPSELGAQ